MYVIISGVKEKIVIYDEVDVEVVLFFEKEGVFLSCLYCCKCFREVVLVISFFKNIICSYNYNYMCIFLLVFLVLCGVYLLFYCVKFSLYVF